MNRKSAVRSLTILCSTVFTISPVMAGDWGYDDGGQPSKSQPQAVTPSGSVPTSIQPATKRKSTAPNSGNLFGRPGAGGASSRPVPGTAVPSGPFYNVENGEGNYGVQLNPPTYEKTGRGQGPGDDMSELEDDTSGPAKPSGTTGGARPAAAPAIKPLSATAAKAKFTADPQALVQECWQQIFQIAGDHELTEEQKGAVNTLVVQRLSGGAQSAGEAKSVATFWPPVTTYLAAHPEQKENYSQLLRALLRWRARMQSQTLGDAKLDEYAKAENSLINEILGPPRVAVENEDVPFTEDAVKAYTDMACFIFDQRHPGKSVDAGDNRELFAKVVCEKFHRAPTTKDRAAMAGFDLSWAKFKIAYQSADQAGRGVLLSKLAGEGAGVAWAHVKDPVLEQVLGRWPAPKTAPPVEPMLAKAQSYSAKPGSDKPAAKPANQASGAAAARHK